MLLFCLNMVKQLNLKAWTRTKNRLWVKDCLPKVQDPRIPRFAWDPRKILSYSQQNHQGHRSQPQIPPSFTTAEEHATSLCKQTFSREGPEIRENHGEMLRKIHCLLPNGFQPKAGIQTSKQQVYIVERDFGHKSLTMSRHRIRRNVLNPQ